MRKFVKWWGGLRYWQKGGIIFLIISLVSFFLTLICYVTTRNAHSDVGIVCNIPMIPLLPGKLLVNILFDQYYFILSLLFTIVFNAIVGIILGRIFESFFKNVKIRQGHIFFIWLIIVELFVIMFKVILKKSAGWDYLLHYTLIFTIFAYILYLIYLGITRKK
ncbi:MAG: hypothetical protein V1859_07060 [archaeon]